MNMKPSFFILEKSLWLIQYRFAGSILKPKGGGAPMNLGVRNPKNLTDSLFCAKYLRIAFLSSINLALILSLCNADFRGSKRSTKSNQDKRETVRYFANSYAIS